MNARRWRLFALGASLPFTLAGFPWFILGAGLAVFAVRPPARGPNPEDC